VKSTSYSEKTLDHFRNPRNVGMLEGDDVAVGRVGNPVCGDIMEMYLRIQDDRIADIKFQTFGCGSAVATSSMTTELVKGMKLDEALRVSRGDVAWLALTIRKDAAGPRVRTTQAFFVRSCRRSPGPASADSPEPVSPERCAVRRASQRLRGTTHP